MLKTSVQYVKEAAKKLINSKLQKLGAAPTQEIFRGVMETVGLESAEEAILFVAHFDLTCQGCTSNMHDLARHFGCSSLDMLEYVPALKSLERKGILMRCRRREENIMKQDFSVSDAAMAAVVDNQPVPIRSVKVEDVKIDKYDFCKRIGQKAEDDDVVTEDLEIFVRKMEQDCAHLPLVGQLKKTVKDILDRTLFYVMCYDNSRQDGDGGSDIERTMKDMFSNFREYIHVRKSINEESHTLMKLGLAEIDESDQDEIRLTDKGMRLYYGDDVKAFERPYKCRDIYDFVKKVSDSFEDRKFDSENSRSEALLQNILCGYEQNNKHIPEIENIRKHLHDDHQRVMLYYIGNDMIDDDSSSLAGIIKMLYPRKRRTIVMNQFKDGTATLQKLEWAEVEKVSSLFGESVRLVLTDKGKEALLGEDAALYVKSVSDKQLLQCDKITEKKLFFPKDLDDQLSTLRNCLQEGNYQALCDRLVEEKQSKGIAALLYGAPGTGKTESALQIAKATGRPIMKVDISETKTMWFGESEKLIKKVFDDYRKLCQASKVKPILFFNEADGIFSKRKDVNIGSCAQTENAIQNIILDELERIDGILIATTNLAINFDDAFERRFLFKIRFDKPSLETKKQIWMDKMPNLSDGEAQQLAAAYDFSGGQIDNIVRKAILEKVVKGVDPTLASLLAMCAQEKISASSAGKIGFC